MVKNTSTIYNKKIQIWEKDIPGYAHASVRAIPTPDSKTFMANVLILYEVENEDYTIILDKDDALEFSGILMYFSKSKYAHMQLLDYDTTLANNIKISYSLRITREKDEVRITVNAGTQDDTATVTLKYPVDVIKEFANAIVRSYEQASDILDANKNLSKQMDQLKKDMKNNKIKELHFEILDEKPEMYNGENDLMRIYEITPYDYNDNPTGYSFLRIAHLTCVPMVDYRDYGKEYLCCPFVYSDKMIERGKVFIQSKTTDLHSYVDSKTGKA